MYFDRTLQSAMTLKDPAALRLLYSRYTSIGLTFRPDAKKMLIIGFGGGSIPKKLNKEFPNLEIDAMEIDPEVVKMAKDHFNVKESKNLRIHAQDGRLFLSSTQTSIRHHLARRLFHRLHAVSSCDQGIFRIGAAQTHAQRHRRRELDQRGHRAVRQNRALLRPNPAPGLSRRPIFSQRAGPITSAWTRSKTSSSSPPATNNESTSRKSSSAPKTLGQGFISRPDPRHCRRLFRQTACPKTFRS